MIHYYHLYKKLLFSTQRIDELPEVHVKRVSLNENNYIYYLKEGDWQKVNSLLALIHPDQISGKKEEINILQKFDKVDNGFTIFPGWIKDKIKNREVGLCNYSYPRWKERLEWVQPEQWVINVVGLGNVGGTLVTGLRLLGGEKIKIIGIFDTNLKAVSRWEREVNQIVDGSDQRILPPVRTVQPDTIFQSDMVVFCISVGVPPPDTEIKDVRMTQLEANSKIINYYAQQARKVKFNGIFAIVSDPVDLLCQSAFLTSNHNEEGKLDGKGLAADQIRGFGLGVMHGRVAYYAEKDIKTKHYLKKGRVFGPHGEGLIVADNVENYHQKLSSFLTKKALNANVELRKIGYKPYIAPALSSGVFSLLAFINGQLHYSAGFLGGIFWGSRNCQTPVGMEWEQFHLSEDLAIHLDKSYRKLRKQADLLEKQMSHDLIILLPGKISSGFISIVREAIMGYSYQIITRTLDIPHLQNKKILWAVELNEYGFNLSLEEMMLAISKRGEKSLENSQGAIIIQSPVELWTKSIAYRIILQTNQLGCRYMGHPVVEATRNLVNFQAWQKQLKFPLSEIYQRNSRSLVGRLIENDRIFLEEPRILVLYSNPKKTSNTMMLWQMIKSNISYHKDKLEEKHVENGTIVDCRGCLYKACKHYSERKSCFYGGIVVQEILPAIEKADYLIWLCPNYNDAVSAKLMAVINRLTVLYKRIEFYKKTIFAVIVSGNSGSENVAMQLIGALNVNKGFQLPPYFSIMAIANDPGAVKLIPDIFEKAQNFARNIGKEIGFQKDS